MRASLLTFIFLAWHLFLTHLLLTKSAASDAVRVSEPVTVLRAASKVRENKTNIKDVLEFGSTVIIQKDREFEKVRQSALVDSNVTIGCR